MIRYLRIPRLSLRCSTPAAALVLLTGMVLIYQFVPVIHFFAPITIAGKNLYTLLPPVVMALLIVVMWPGLRRSSLSARTVLVLLALVFLWMLTLTARSAFYGENGNILYQRFIILLFIYAAVFMHFTRDAQTREWLGLLMVAVGVTQACAGLLHAYLFPYIQFLPDGEGGLILTFEGELTRESGTLVSSSMFANVVVCAQFVILGEKRIPFLVKLVLAAIMCYAVTLSGSRYPTIMSFFLSGCLLVNRRIDRTAPVVLSAAAILGLLILLSGKLPIESKSIMRFGQDDGGRFDKLFLSLDLIFEHWQHWLLGVPNRIVAAARTLEGMQVSDNSFTLIALQFGLPLLVLWLVCISVLIVRRPPGLLAPLMVLYFFVNLTITNSILWEPWLFYFSLALWVVRRRAVDSGSAAADLEKQLYKVA